MLGHNPDIHIIIGPQSGIICMVYEDEDGKYRKSPLPAQSSNPFLSKIVDSDSKHHNNTYFRGLNEIRRSVIIS